MCPGIYRISGEGQKGGQRSGTTVSAVIFNYCHPAQYCVNSRRDIIILFCQIRVIYVDRKSKCRKTLFTGNLIILAVQYSFIYLINSILW